MDARFTRNAAGGGSVGYDRHRVFARPGRGDGSSCLNGRPSAGYLRGMSMRRFLGLMLAGSIFPAAPAAAQEAEVPYWASIRAPEVNMRAGPGEDYRISWVYRRPQLPIKVLRLKEGWRLVQDPDGAQGWMLARFLTRQRGGYITGKDHAEMRESAEAGAKLLWRLEPGVTGLLGECQNGWCAFSVGERKGYVEQARIWGAGEP